MNSTSPTTTTTGQDRYNACLDDTEYINSPNTRSHSVNSVKIDSDYAFLDRKKFGRTFRKFLHFIGPGVVMSIAYVDPGNIESNLQSGSLGGYSLLWVLLWSTIAGGLFQVLAARLGVVSGQHLAQLCRATYPKTPRLILWVMMEVAIIGSDVQEVIGSAIAIQLLTNGYIPLWGGVLVTALDTLTFLFMENYSIRKLEMVFLFLLAVMAVMFGIQFVISEPDSLDVMEGIFVPKILNHKLLTQAVGMIGAIIMPHNLYLHSGLVLSRTKVLVVENIVKDDSESSGLPNTTASDSNSHTTYRSISSGDSAVAIPSSSGGSTCNRVWNTSSTRRLVGGNGEDSEEESYPMVENATTSKELIEGAGALSNGPSSNHLIIKQIHIGDLKLTKTSSFVLSTDVSSALTQGSGIDVNEASIIVNSKNNSTSDLRKRRHTTTNAVAMEEGLNPDNNSSSQHRLGTIMDIGTVNTFFAVETAIALIGSFMINLFVVCVFAVGFYKNPNVDPDDIGLEKSGQYLLERYGVYAYYIWAIGLLASGQSSTMTGTYAGQFVMGGFLELKTARWKRVLFTRSLAIVPAVLVALNASSNMDGLNESLNILQSVQLPFALIPLLYFSTNKEVMGQYTLSRFNKIGVWVLAFVLIVANCYMMRDYINDHLPDGETSRMCSYVILSLAAFVYFALIIYYSIGPGCIDVLKRKVFGERSSDSSYSQEHISSNSDYNTELDDERAVLLKI